MAQTQEPLLSAESLAGVRLGISVSESADLPRLGLREAHFRLALGELARTVLIAGGELNYGGYLDATGYGAFLARELHRFARRDRPFHSILAWPEHRRVDIATLQTYKADLGLYGDLTGLDTDGAVMDVFSGRPPEGIPEPDVEIVKKSLTALRRFMTSKSSGRIFIGGKRHGFQGDMPGVVEECILAAEAGQPVFLAGGFGGATSDLAAMLIPGGADWIPADADVNDPLYDHSLTLAKAAFERSAESLDNGLSVDENRRLAVSHRPSEIAALVGLGLGRKFQS